jgi:hypothetical protein
MLSARYVRLEKEREVQYRDGQDEIRVAGKLRERRC